VATIVEEECGLKITEQDLRTTVDRYMRDRLEVFDCADDAWVKQWCREDADKAMQDNEIKNSWRNHGMHQNTCDEHERPK